MGPTIITSIPHDGIARLDQPVYRYGIRGKFGQDVNSLFVRVCHDRFITIEI